MVVWSLPAKEDLKNIYDFIATNSNYYALKVSLEFIDKSEYLIEFPKTGRIVPEIDNPKIRELFIYSYRLIYKLSNKDIYILAIIHGRQKFIGEMVED